MTTNLKSSEFATLFRDQASLHWSLRSLGYLLPKPKDKLVNSQFLTGVANGKIYVPKAPKMYFQDSFNPPSVDQLVIYVLDALNSFNREGISTESILSLAKLIEETTPQKKFLIRLLSQLNPHHEIFNLDYTPPAELVKASPAEEHSIMEIDERLVAQGVAAKRKRGAKRLRVSQASEDQELSN